MTVTRPAAFQARVYAVVRSVPRGKVVSYGGVAAILGQPRAARGVGRALCALPADTDVPWWRVVNRNGEISIRGAMHGAIVQRKLLEREGVRFDRHGRIDWRIYGWTGDAPPTMTQPPTPHVVESVALAIDDPTRPGKILTVRRPPDDPDLPDAWGLPAASLRAGESAADAAHRAARDKLGVTLDLGPEINQGTIRRADTLLSMRLFAARVREGRPRVPQPVPDVTQYTALQWDTSDALRPAAQRGSLCCRLALDSLDDR